MSRPSTRPTLTASVVTGLVHLLVAIGLGVGVAAGAVVWLDDRRDTAIAAEQRAAADYAAAEEQRARPGANDRIDAAVEELLRDGVHVTADGRSIMDAEAEAEVQAAFADAPVRMLAVVWAPGQQVGMSPIVLHDAVEQAVRDRVGDERTALFIWEGPEQGEVVLLPDEGYIDGYGVGEFAGDAATFLSGAAGAVTVDDFNEPRDDSIGDDSDYWGGVGGGGLLGLMLAVTIIAVTLGLAKLVAVGLGRRRLLPGHWAWSRSTEPRGRRGGAR